MSGFDHLPKLIDKGRRSPFWLRVLNVLVAYVIPFNRPHGFRVLEIGDDRVLTCAPYRRKNHNHLRGIHACAIATISEFSAGFLLLSKLDPAKYRLIMSHLEVEYLYQAKQEIVAQSILSEEDFRQVVIDPLRVEESCSIVMETRVKDREENEIAVAKTTWQIKRWDKVRTKVK